MRDAAGLQDEPFLCCAVVRRVGNSIPPSGGRVKALRKVSPHQLHRAGQSLFVWRKDARLRRRSVPHVRELRAVEHSGYRQLQQSGNALRSMVEPVQKSGGVSGVMGQPDLCTTKKRSISDHFSGCSPVVCQEATLGWILLQHLGKLGTVETLHWVLRCQQLMHKRLVSGGVEPCRVVRPDKQIALVRVGPGHQRSRVGLPSAE
mmetsp:Transcript_33597/g.81251  ORF Transcript_33597/g.81251 Transcript_33597/m.81251 type:complete len:204 (-) Transcript_33597:979-1590(-)